MSTVNGSDLLAVERSGTLYKLRQDELSTLNNTDLLAVERGGTLYKIAAEDLELVTGTISTPVSVVTPVNGSGTNHGQNYNPLSSAITAVAGGGTVTTVETSEITGVTKELNWVDSITQGYGPWNYRVFDADNATDVINGGASHGARQSDKCGDNSINACHIMSFDFTRVQSNGLSVSSALEVYTYENSSAGPNYDTLHYRVNGGSWVQASLGGNGWLTVATSGTVNTLDLRHKESQYTSNRPSVWGFRLDGNIINGLGRPTVTLADNTNVSNLAVGTSVRQEPSYTPQTAAVSSVTATESGWDDISSSLSFPITITSIGWNSGGGGDGCGLAAIEIDGTRITDPNGNKAGNTSYSGTYYSGTTANIFDNNYIYPNSVMLVGRPNGFTINFGSGVLPQATTSVRLLWATQSGNSQVNGNTIRQGNHQYGGATAQQSLNFSANTDLADLQAGDTVTKSTDSAVTGTIDSVNASSSNMVVNATTFAVGDVLNGPTFQQTDTIRAISGNNISLNNAAGRWFANENLALGKREGYNTKLTFTDNTELANMIGTASMADSSGNILSYYESTGTIGTVTTAPTYSSGTTVAYSTNNGGSWTTMSPDAAKPLSNAFSGETLYYVSGGRAEYNLSLNTTYQVRLRLPSAIGSNFNTVKIWSGLRFCSTSSVSVNGTSATIDSSQNQVVTTLTVSNQVQDIIWTCRRDGAGFTLGIDGIEVNGEMLVDGLVRLPMSSNGNLTQFAVGDTVEQDTITGTSINSAVYGSFASGSLAGAFDGNTGANDRLGIRPNGSGASFDAQTVSSQLRVYCGVETNQGTLYLNKTINTNQAPSRSSPGWVDVTSYITTPFSLTDVGFHGGSNGAGADIYAIEIDGNILTETYLASGKIIHLDSTPSTPEIKVAPLNTGTWTSGKKVRKTFTTPTIGTVVKVDGSELYGANVAGTFTTGNYLKGATSTIQAPTASSVVFTSANDGTAAYNGTLSQLLKRVWSLETSNSASGPWSAATTYDDTSVFSTQTGATAWAGRPTLLANTFYRVKVTYEATNAVDVTSSANIFRTGAA